ncbi:MAG: hypothetical protein MPK36_08445, partial [Gammaproteobacteria bacterium]|nr:hypothetical protein [Gammaproteobacteria bacterium]
MTQALANILPPRAAVSSGSAEKNPDNFRRFARRKERLGGGKRSSAVQTGCTNDSSARKHPTALRRRVKRPGGKNPGNFCFA